MSDNPFTAYNHARFGITISSMEMVAKIAHMKIANPGRTRAMIERGSGYEVDAKLCYSVNARQINETEVYVAFMDRILQRARDGHHGFGCQPLRLRTLYPETPKELN